MKHLITILALMCALTSGAQTGLVEFPYNPDADGNDIIGTADLLELLSLFGSEFAEENLYVNEDETAATYHVQGGWNYGMCSAKCSELPSGKWKIIDLDNWAEFHLEIEAISNPSVDNFWLTDDVRSFGYSGSNDLRLVVVGTGEEKGAVEARNTDNDKGCVCALHERPKVEYSVCISKDHTYNIPNEGYQFSSFQECCSNKVLSGWYPLGGLSKGSHEDAGQAFWRWAE